MSYFKGHYLPVFASEIVDQNMIAKAQNRSEINLVSVLIGNGITDIYTYVLNLLLTFMGSRNTFKDDPRSDGGSMRHGIS